MRKLPASREPSRSLREHRRPSFCGAHDVAAVAVRLRRAEASSRRSEPPETAELDASSGPSALASRCCSLVKAITPADGAVLPLVVQASTPVTTPPPRRQTPAYPAERECRGIDRALLGVPLTKLS